MVDKNGASEEATAAGRIYVFTFELMSRWWGCGVKREVLLVQRSCHACSRSNYMHPALAGDREVGSNFWDHSHYAL
jgi:hypothetical protein